MKRLFVLFLIVLLPLRGWAGDIISVRMANQQTETGSQVMQMVSMPPDCPMHAHAQSHTSHQSDAGDAHVGSMKNCTSCDLCLPLAGLPCSRLDFVTFASDDKPLIGADDFVSAALALAEKPPIS